MKLLILAKAPVAGRVKTRLIPALGAEGAARLAGEMLGRTVAEAKASGIDAELRADPAPADPSWRGHLPNIPAEAQGQGDLGARLWRAVESAGCSVLLIGTDCPGLDAAALQAAAAALERCDAVIYPAEDGGYVLLGLKRADPSLFDGIAWSTSEVAAQTIARIRALGWSLHVGPTLRDIDEPADLL